MRKETIMNEAILSNVYEELKHGYVSERLKAIYLDIYLAVKEVPAEILSSKMTSKESSGVNRFQLELDKEARRVTVKAMQDMGIPDERIALLWAQIRRRAGVPDVRLCSNDNYSQTYSEIYSEITGAADHSKEKAAISDKTWPPMVKWIRHVLMKTGIVTLHDEKPTAPRKPLTDAAMRQVNEQFMAYVKDICNRQCRLNEQAFFDWLDQLYRVTLEACNSEINFS